MTRAYKQHHSAPIGDEEEVKLPPPQNLTQPLRPPRLVGGIELWDGNRRWLHWDKDYGTWKTEQADENTGEYTCQSYGHWYHHPECVGSSTNAGDFQGDHVTELRDYLEAVTGLFVACDGTWHWIAITRADAQAHYSDQNNLQLLCGKCNSKKNAKQGIDKDPSVPYGRCTGSGCNQHINDKIMKGKKK